MRGARQRLDRGSPEDERVDRAHSLDRRRNRRGLGFAATSQGLAPSRTLRARFAHTVSFGIASTFGNVASCACAMRGRLERRRQYSGAQEADIFDVGGHVGRVPDACERRHTSEAVA